MIWDLNLNTRKSFDLLFLFCIKFLSILDGSLDYSSFLSLHDHFSLYNLTHSSACFLIVALFFKKNVSVAV